MLLLNEIHVLVDPVAIGMPLNSEVSNVAWFKVVLATGRMNVAGPFHSKLAPKYGGRSAELLIS